jgi:hypothetical protein
LSIDLLFSAGKGEAEKDSPDERTNRAEKTFCLCLDILGEHNAFKTPTLR